MEKDKQSITIVIGHRGVGKSELGKRLQSFGCLVLDLDNEVEKKSGRQISEIFEIEGESEFRRKEEQVFTQLLSQYRENSQPVVLILGAGFQFDLPQDVFIIWLQRESDSLGRIFLDRPRLLQKLKPLDEFQVKYQERAQRWKSLNHQIYQMPEGPWPVLDIERWYFTSSKLNCGGGFTLQSSHLRSNLTFSKLRRAGFDFIELRTDLLSERELRQACEEFAATDVLISLRECSYLNAVSDLLENRSWDWAHELGPCLYKGPEVLSFHSRPGDQSLERFLKEVDQVACEVSVRAHIKVSVDINSFQELQCFYRWWKENPQNRSIFPCGEGRWTWFRQWMKGRCRLNFVREGSSGQVDQPTLSQWLRTPSCSEGFAAVLGTPVEHSWSPSYHSEFFNEKNMPFWAIDIREEEWSEAFSFLKTLGLKAAAVTSPLKKRVMSESMVESDVVSKLGVANTIWTEQDEWRSENTDDMAFLKLLESVKLKEGKVIVWGGGGMLPLMLKNLPEAHFYSARTGQERGHSKSSTSSLLGHECVNNTPSSSRFERKLFAPPFSKENIAALIWAVGASRQSECVWPDVNWNPEVVIDVNYAENSPGREYALKCGARYISGERLFVEQAYQQQKLWVNV